MNRDAGLLMTSVESHEVTDEEAVLEQVFPCISALRRHDSAGETVAFGLLVQHGMQFPLRDRVLDAFDAVRIDSPEQDGDTLISVPLTADEIAQPTIQLARIIAASLARVATLVIRK